MCVVRRGRIFFLFNKFGQLMVVLVLNKKKMFWFFFWAYSLYLTLGHDRNNVCALKILIIQIDGGST